MVKLEINEDLYLRSFTLNDEDEFYNLTIESKDFLKEWLYDHYVDHEVYGLLKKEWKNKS